MTTSRDIMEHRTLIKVCVRSGKSVIEIKMFLDAVDINGIWIFCNTLHKARISHQSNFLYFPLCNLLCVVSDSRILLR